MKYQSRRPYSNIFRFTGWIVLIILLQVTTVPVFTQSLPTSPDGTNGESAEPGGPRQMDFIPPADAASLAEFAPTRSTERTMTAVTGQTIQSDVSQQLDTLFRFNEDTVGVFVESDTFVEAVEIQFHPKNEVETGYLAEFQLDDSGPINETFLEFEIEAVAESTGAEIERFDKEVRLIVDLRPYTQGVDMSGGEFFLAYRDEDNPNMWHNVPIWVHQEDGLISATVDHFSDWTTGWRPTPWGPSFNEPGVSSFSGAATYQYPIEVPPGRAGLQPSVLLSYSSRGLDGSIHGVGKGSVASGWTLADIRIVRDEVEIKDGKLVHPDKFRLVLNGTGYKLQPAGSTTANTLQYHAQDNPSLRIFRYFDSSAPNQEGLYWVVQTPDGTQYRLGFFAQAEEWQRADLHGEKEWHGHGGRQSTDEEIRTSATAWHVDTVTDLNGNQITYNYYHETSSHYACYDICGFQLLHWKHAVRLWAISYNFPGQVSLNGDGTIPHDSSLVRLNGTQTPGTRIEFHARGYVDIWGNWNENQMGQIQNIFIYHGGNVYSDNPMIEYRIEAHDITITSDKNDCYDRTGNYGLSRTTRVVDTIQQWSGTDRNYHAQETTDGDTFALPATSFTYIEKPHYLQDGNANRPCFSFMYLKSVNNGYGGNVTFEYTSDGRQVNSFQGQDWNGAIYQWFKWPSIGFNYFVTKVTRDDGINPSVITTYQYERPCYGQWGDNVGGYSNPIKCHSPGVSEYGNINGFHKTTITQKDFNGTSLSVSKTEFAQVDNLTNLAALWYIGSPVNQEQFEANGTILLAGTTTSYALFGSGTAVFYKPREIISTQYFNGNSLSTRVYYEHYDAYGNARVVYNYGDTATSSDDKTVMTRYYHNAGALWLVAQPAGERTFSGIHSNFDDTTNLLVETQTFYDYRTSLQAPVKGQVTMVKAGRTGSNLGGGSNGLITSSQLEYDEYGNVDKSTSTSGAVTTITYDGTYHLYPIQTVTSGNGVTTQTTDVQIYGFNGSLNGFQRQRGLIKQITDPNDLTTIYEYDPFGRLYQVYEPGDSQGTLSDKFDGDPAMRYRYWDNSWNNSGQIWSTNTVYEVETSGYPWHGFGSNNGNGAWQSPTVNSGQGPGFMTFGPYDPPQAIGPGQTAHFRLSIDSITAGSGSDVVATIDVFHLGSSTKLAERNITRREFAYSDLGTFTDFALTFNSAGYENENLEYRVHWKNVAVIAHDSTTIVWNFDGQATPNEAPFGISVHTRPNTYSSSGPYVMKHMTYYDGFGRPIQEQEYSVSVEGQANPRTIVTTNAYNALGQVSCVTTPYDISDAQATWPNNNFQTASCANKINTTTTYDALGRARFVTAPDGSTTETRYSINTNEGPMLLHHNTINANNQRFRLSYNARGELVMAQEYTGDCGEYWGYSCAGGGTTWAPSLDTNYSYDLLGNLTKVQQRDSANDTLYMTTTISYDALGRKTGMTDPDMGTWGYEYNAVGSLVRQKDARGNAICFYYDALDRITGKIQDNTPEDACAATNSVTSGAFHLASYSYDTGTGSNAIGQLTQVKWGPKPGLNFDKFYYNGLGLMYKQDRTIDDRLYTMETTSFDPLHRPLTIKYPNGEIVTMTYDHEGENSLNAGGTALVNNVTYNAQGQMMKLDRSSGPDTTYNYHPASDVAGGGTGDSNFRLANITTGSLLNLSYQYDDVGNITRITDNLLSSNKTQNFTYDHLNRLVTASTPSGAVDAYNHTYNYDKLGNITSMVEDSTTLNYTYHANKVHAVTSVGSDTYKYDANGNMTYRTADDGTTIYRQYFDVENRLVVVNDDPNEGTGFVYDANGQRVKTIQADGTAIYTPFPGYEEEVRPSILFQTDFESSGEMVENNPTSFPATSRWWGTWGSSTPSSGDRAYAISNHAYGYLLSDPITVSGNTAYNLQAYIRGELDPEDSSGGWIIRAYYYDANGTYLDWENAANGSAGTSVSTTWTQKGGTITTHPNAATLRIALYNHNTSGWLAFDDVSLQRVSDQTMLTVPNASFENGANGTSATNWTTVTPGAFSNTSFWRGTWSIGTPQSGSYAFTISNLAYGSLMSDQIDVEPNTQYDLHAWVRGELDPDDSETVSGRWRIDADFLDSAGNVISEQYAAAGAAGSLTTSWQKQGGTITTPANAVRMRIELHNYMNSGWVAYDDVTLVKTSDQTPLTVTNASFEDSSGWIQASPFSSTSFWRGATWGTSAGRTGGTAYAISNHAFGILDSNQIPVEGNAEYDLYAWIRGEIDDDDSYSTWYLRLSFYDAGGNLIAYSADQNADYGAGGSISSDWQYRGGRVTAPANAVTAQVRLINHLNSGWVAFDQVLFTKASEGPSAIAPLNFTAASAPALPVPAGTSGEGIDGVTLFAVTLSTLSLVGFGLVVKQQGWHDVVSRRAVQVLRRQATAKRRAHLWQSISALTLVGVVVSSMNLAPIVLAAVPVSAPAALDDSGDLENPAASVALGPVQSPWVSADIGSVGVSGSADETSGTYTIDGAGDNIAGTVDAFHFVYQSLAGDGSITANAVSLSGGGSTPRMGLMMRDGLTADAAHVAAVVQGNRIRVLDRASSGGDTTDVAGYTQGTPEWLRIERSGNTFALSRSNDGVSWTVMQTRTIRMGTTIYVGMAVTGNSTTTLATGVFDNVSVSGGSPSCSYGPYDLSQNNRIEAEDFRCGGEGIAFHEDLAADTGPGSGDYRTDVSTDGPDLQTTTDVGGGYNLGWTRPGEWLEYEIIAPQAGDYDFTIRYAADTDNTPAFRLTVNQGRTQVADSGVVNLVATGGPQIWADHLMTLSLAQGTNILRLAIEDGHGNYNYMDIQPAATSTPTPTATATSTATPTATNTPVATATSTATATPSPTPSPTPPPAPDPEVVIRRVTYSIAGQAIAVRMTGHPDGNNGLYYLHSDHLGSNSVMSTMAGAKVSETRYLPFGGYRTAPTNNGDTLTDRGYTGHKENMDIGLIYMNARYYVPGIARFASADTIVPNPANPQSFNRYSYVLNNPLRFIDPTGHRYYEPSCDCMVDDGDSNSNWDSNLERAFDWDPLQETRIGNFASGWTIPENVNGPESNKDADDISEQSPFLIESTNAVLSSDEALWLSEQMMFEADQAGAIDSFFNRLEILGIDLEKLGLLSEKTLPVSIGLAQLDEAGGVAQDIAIALATAAGEGNTVILSGGYDLTGWGVAINGDIVTHQPPFILAVPLTTLDLYLLELEE